MDIMVTDYGALVGFVAFTAYGAAWIKEHVPAVSVLAGGFYADPLYAGTIVEEMAAAGLRLAANEAKEVN